MYYVDIFWHTFKDGFVESEEARDERQQKERLSAILGEPIVVEGELYSH